MTANNDNKEVNLERGTIDFEKYPVKYVCFSKGNKVIPYLKLKDLEAWLNDAGGFDTLLKKDKFLQTWVSEMTMVLFYRAPMPPVIHEDGEAYLCIACAAAYVEMVDSKKEDLVFQVQAYLEDCNRFLVAKLLAEVKELAADVRLFNK